MQFLGEKGEKEILDADFADNKKINLPRKNGRRAGLNKKVVRGKKKKMDSCFRRNDKW
jgi:hypothetical protein